MARIRSVKPELCTSETMAEQPALPYKKRAIPQASRRALAERVIGRVSEGVELYPALCARCGAPGGIFWPLRSDGRHGGWVHFPDLEIDHVHPESAGGSHDAHNLQLLCRSCNRRKGAKV